MSDELIGRETITAICNSLITTAEEISEKGFKVAAASIRAEVDALRRIRSYPPAAPRTVALKGERAVEWLRKMVETYKANHVGGYCDHVDEDTLYLNQSYGANKEAPTLAQLDAALGRESEGEK